MALDKDAIKTAIKGRDGSGLQQEIYDDLGEVLLELETKDAQGKDITISIQPFNADEIDRQFKNDPRTMTDVPTGNHDKYTGIEAIVEVVVEKTIDKVIDTLVDQIINNLEITVPAGTVVVAATGASTNPLPITCSKK